MTTKPRATPARPRAAKAPRSRAAAIVLLVGPAVLLGAIAYHPLTHNLTDVDAVGAALHANLDTWGAAHVLAATGGILVLLGFLAIRAHLAHAGEERWSGMAIGPLVVGSVLFAMLPAMELGILAGVQAGAPAATVQAAANTWFIPTMLAHAAAILTGSVLLAVAVVRSQLLSPWAARVAAGALLAGAAFRFVPSGLTLYVVAAATLVAFWVLGLHLWSHTPQRDEERAWRMAAG